MKKVVVISLVILICSTLWSQQSSDTDDGFDTAFADWLQQWESQNIDGYLWYYHPAFRSETSKQDIDQWTAHKKRIFNPSRPVQVKFTDIKSTFADSIMIFEAYQDYQSRNYSDFGRKTMKWIWENNAWKIIAEDWVVAERPTEIPIDEPIEPPIEEPIEPPVVIPPPDTLTPQWEKLAGQVPFEFINILLAKTHPLYPLRDDGNANYLIIVEKKDQTAGLYLFEDDFTEITLLKAYHISSGQVAGNKEVVGDLKTPEGLYWTTSFRPAETLEAKFGSGAFVLNYPNELDRLRKKTGSGIWIHGSDIDMVPFDTEGCVRFDNEVITYFKEELDFGRVPVIIGDSLEWTTTEALTEIIDDLHTLVDKWKDAWEKQDIEAYLSFYDADEFISHKQKMDYEKWVNHKQNIFSPNKKVRLAFSDYRYHYADDLLLITFNQDYTADSYSDYGRKQMVFRRIPQTSDSRPQTAWVIIQEEWTAARKR